MTTTDTEPRYKLGLIHDPLPSIVPDLECFATAPIPVPPPTVAAPEVEWPMADNDTLGDCTIAGAVHLDQAGAAVTDEPWTYPGDVVVSRVYLGLTGGPDTGLQLPQVLTPWKTPGLFGSQNGGFASVNVKNTTLVKQSVWIFGGLYIAVNLPAVAQQQFRPNGSGVWELTGTPADYDIEGGHCVAPVGYTPKGVIAVTWGSTVLITWQWWHTYVVQAYAVVPPAFVTKGGDARGFDLAAIDGYLKVA
jgi:hypothetical protein